MAKVVAKKSKLGTTIRSFVHKGNDPNLSNFSGDGDHKILVHWFTCKFYNNRHLEEKYCKALVHFFLYLNLLAVL